MQSPEDRARRRTQAVMERQAPSDAQVHYLRDILGDRGPLPANKWEASQRIDALKHQKEVG